MIKIINWNIFENHESIWSQKSGYLYNDVIFVSMKIAFKIIRRRTLVTWQRIPLIFKLGHSFMILSFFNGNWFYNEKIDGMKNHWIPFWRCMQKLYAWFRAYNRFIVKNQCFVRNFLASSNVYQPFKTKIVRDRKLCTWVLKDFIQVNRRIFS